MTSSLKTETTGRALKAVEASPENRELFLLGRKMIEGSIEAVQDMLKQLLTLATALLGGSIAFTSDQLMPFPFKAVIVASFLLTVGISIWGMMPYGADLCPNLPQTVREARDKSLDWKMKRLQWAGFFLVAGFFVAFVGLLVRSFG